jgi:hypothetical protein
VLILSFSVKDFSPEKKDKIKNQTFFGGCFLCWLIFPLLTNRKVISTFFNILNKHSYILLFVWILHLLAANYSSV